MRKSRHPLNDLSFIAPVDWARLAAFIDGEGTIGSGQTVHKDPKFKGARSRYEYIKVTITNTVPRLSAWITRTFGGNVQCHTNNKIENPNWRPCFFWSVSCLQAAAILNGVMPYLLLKREQAETALAMQATMVHSGRRGTPQEVIDHRAELKSKLHALNARGPRVAAVSE